MDTSAGDCMMPLTLKTKNHEYNYQKNPDMGFYRDPVYSLFLPYVCLEFASCGSASSFWH
jgi:hypothetical protein